MKWNFTLWTFALACAAMSCSDDVDGTGSGTENGEELNGETTYVNVSINTEATTSTKASIDDEEGDGNEIGLTSEYTVNDVTIVLFNNGESSTDYSFLGTSTICGVGYATVSSNSTSSLEKHQWQASVEISMNGSSLIGETYGVIAITNLGDPTATNTYNTLYTNINNGTYTTGSQLANHLITNYQSSGFIMSTHTMRWPASTGEQSIVTVAANVTEANAPTVNVYVERLAAKVRIKQYESATNYIYTLTSNNSAIAKVRLDSAVVVNQLNSGSYCLKRVSDNNPSFSDAMNVNYLGDEAYSSSDATSTNYVLDPWITKRDRYATLPTEGITTQTSQALTYLNRFIKPTSTTDSYSYDELWATYKNTSTTTTNDNEKIKLLANGTVNDNGGIRLAYTQENTLQVAHSIVGYATGVLFKATYMPKSWTIVGTDGISTTPEEVDYTENTDGTGFDDAIDKSSEGVSFYVYNGVVYKDQTAIFVDILNKSVSNTSTYNYSKFTETNFNSMTIEEFNANFANVDDPFGYIEDLNEEIKKYTGDGTTMEALGTAVESFPEFIKSFAGTSIGDAIYYEKGLCYYPYWIRHENNDNNASIGMMEFSIVRNNIYDLTVTGMNGLGTSGTQPIPGGDEPTEDEDAMIRVVMYVKNWVVRSNSTIIL